MKIASLSIEAFGNLCDREFTEIPDGVVVVRGLNESGKSTLFHFLASLLYGFSPARLEQHPYAPWDGARIAGSAALLLNNGEKVHVRRRLLSQPQGWLEREGQDEDLRNQAISPVSHVSREVFEEVYALTLDDLRFFGDQAWERVQDRLLAGLATDFLRSPREVVSSLREEAAGLWRSDRRGRPRAKEIEARLSELRKERRDAEERDKRIRGDNSGLTQIRVDLENLRRRKVQLQTLLRRAERLSPVRKALQRSKELQEEAGDIEEFSGLPDSPRDRLEGLDEQLAELTDRREVLEKEIERRTNEVQGFTEKHLQVLRHRETIRRWTGELGRLAADRDRIEDVKREVDRVENQRDEESKDILVEPWSDRFPPALAKMSKAELRARVDAFQQAERSYREAQERVRGVEARRAEGQAHPLPIWMIVVLAFSVGLLTAGTYAEQKVLVVLGIVGIIIGGGGLWSWYQLRREELRAREEYVRDLRMAQDELQRGLEHRTTRKGGVASLLSDLPIAEGRLECPDATLVQDIIALQETLKRIDSLRSEEREVRERLDGRIVSVADLSRELNLDAAGTSEEQVALMEGLLDEAEDAKRRSEEATEEIEKIRPELDRVLKKERILEEERGQIEEQLANVGEGDVEVGLSRLHARRRAKEQVEEMRLGLERDYPELEEMQDEIRRAEEEEEGWIFSDEDVVGARDEIERISEEITGKEKKAAELGKDVEHLQEQVTLDQLDSERETLKEVLQELRCKRDRLELLAAVLRVADQQFREEHQPDVLLRAGSYLQKITDGRYERLFLEDQEDGQQLMIKQEREALPIPVMSPISHGTLDQIYLALRLSLVDHLDAGRETLPLFLDEILIRWDGIRLESGIELLREIGENRQVFLFTCHEWLAEQLIATLTPGEIDLRVHPK